MQVDRMEMNPGNNAMWKWLWGDTDYTKATERPLPSWQVL